MTGATESGRSADGRERCDECGEKVELIESDAENPLTGDTYDRYKCPCGKTTVLDFDRSLRTEAER